MRTAPPVSYTHLDVYKRQVLSCAARTPPSRCSCCKGPENGIKKTAAAPAETGSRGGFFDTKEWWRNKGCLLYTSIPAFIEQNGIRDGIMHACVAHGVPYVLAGSIRDDGPLPGVYGDVYAAQNAMRELVQQATTVILSLIHI